MRCGQGGAAGEEAGEGAQRRGEAGLGRGVRRRAVRWGGVELRARLWRAGEPVGGPRGCCGGGGGGPVARGAASGPRGSRGSSRQAVAGQEEDPMPSASAIVTADTQRSPPARTTRPRAPRKAAVAAATPSSSPGDSAQPDAPPTPAPAPSSPRPRRPRAKKAAADPASSSSAAAAADPSIPPQPSPAPAPSPRRDGPALGGTLLVVDGNYLANRSYFGYGARGLSTTTGVPTSVTYGVLRALREAVRSVRPTALAVVFDNGPTFRGLMSLLDPSGPGGAVAARLVREGRLDWQASARVRAWGQ
ncbi:DNA polymerase I [Tetrabaena socialis]|uniref:DNA polymerase I n=1 Tax=Tetrabaena socialis TaxID=47790 RepID=A0A2J7ZGU7_9CHLO|nr:DNA polymerase I [Tetrabaena socialis]|eukprot:PNG99459.1 DNA polymerase I [Tetrabaena socialis]